MTPQELIKEIEAQRNLMITVATGGPRIQDVNEEYLQRRQRINDGLSERGIDDSNPYSDLWRWYAKWSTDLQGYRARREYVADLYDPLLDKVRQFKAPSNCDQVFLLLKELEEFEVNVNVYFDDGVYQSLLEDTAFSKVKALRAYFQKLNLNDLVTAVENIELHQGGLISVLEMLRGFVIPEARLRVQRIIQGAPPTEPQLPETENVLPHSLVAGTRGYIEKIVFQINGTYDQGWFDACAVMIRRLIETLIIEAFEKHNIASHIQSPSGDYLFLRDLINRTVAETVWNLGRNTKAALPRLKDIGDQSAHSRRFVAQRTDIERIIPDLRIVAQELLFIAGLK
jgi:hypothetical protein